MNYTNSTRFEITTRSHSFVDDIGIQAFQFRIPYVYTKVPLRIPYMFTKINLYKRLYILI